MSILTARWSRRKTRCARATVFFGYGTIAEVRTKLELLEANVRDRIDAPLISPYFAPLKRENNNASGIFRFFSLFRQASQSRGPDSRLKDR